MNSNIDLRRTSRTSGTPLRIRGNAATLYFADKAHAGVVAATADHHDHQEQEKVTMGKERAMRVPLLSSVEPSRHTRTHRLCLYQRTHSPTGNEALAVYLGYYRRLQRGQVHCSGCCPSAVVVGPSRCARYVGLPIREARMARQGREMEVWTIVGHLGRRSRMLGEPYHGTLVLVLGNTAPWGRIQHRTWSRLQQHRDRPGRLGPSRW